MKGLIAFLLILIIGGLGYTIWDKEMTKRRVAAEVREAALERAADERMRREQRYLTEQAILAGQVLVGMSRYEARQAWGTSYDVDRSDITDEERSKGAYETWHYQDNRKGVLYMSVDGTVLGVSRYSPSN